MPEFRTFSIRGTVSGIPGLFTISSASSTRASVWPPSSKSILYLLNPGKPFNAHDLRASLPGVSKVVASIAVYIILFATVGLPLGTFLFLLLFFYLMRYRDIRRMLPFALLGAGLTWLVFEKILGVVVPQPFWLGLF